MAGLHINGQPAVVRYAARQKLSQPKVETFFVWSEQQLLRIPGKSDLAKAFRYGLNWQDAFSLFPSQPLWRVLNCRPALI